MFITLILRLISDNYTFLEIYLYICNTFLEINHETNFVQKITIMEK